MAWGTRKKEAEVIRNHTLQTRVVAVVLVAAIGLVAGCGTLKGLGGGRDKGILKYAMPKGQVLKYQVSQDLAQTMEFMGQKTEANMKKAYVFSAESKGLKEKDHSLRITIDSMEAGITTPQGDLSPDVSALIGKGFDMTLSQFGKELDLSGADSLQFSVGPQGTQSLKSDFQTMFPDLPGTPLKPGDTWTSQDTIAVSNGGMEIRIESQRVNTLAGFESVDGLKCAKITVAVTGTLKGQGSQMGAAVTLDGNIEGTDTWYFAPEKGLFVKSSSDLITKGTVTLSGAQSMTIPMTQEIKSETAIVR